MIHGRGEGGEWYVDGGWCVGGVRVMSGMSGQLVSGG